MPQIKNPVTVVSGGGSDENFKALIDGSLSGVVTIPSGVTTIKDNAFSACANITSFIFPSTLNNIRTGAFQGCTGLTGAFAIPNSVTVIGGSMLQYCTGITSIYIPDSATIIGNNAFYGCTSVTDLHIGNGAAPAVLGIFGNLTSLTTITASDGLKFLTLRFIDSPLITDQSLINLANAYISDTKTRNLTLHATPKARCSTLLGTVTDGVFTADEDGDTTLLAFYNSKGVTIA